MKRCFLKEDLVALEQAIEVAQGEVARTKAELTRSYAEQTSPGDNGSYARAIEAADIAVSRLGALREAKKYASIVTPNENTNRVAVGRTVTLEIDGRGCENYTIGSFWIPEQPPWDPKKDPQKVDRISYSSPLAQAVIGGKVGEIRELVLSGKLKRKIRIVSIE